MFFYKKNEKQDCIIYKIFGIKFKVKKVNNDEIKKLESRIFYNDIYSLFEKNPLHLPDKNFKGHALASYIWDNMRLLYPNVVFEDISNYKNLPDFAVLWGFGYNEGANNVVKLASQLNIPLYIIEDGFIKSADTWCNYSADIKYRNGVSFTIDCKAPYFDGTRSSLLEQMLNDKSLIIDDKQKQRARSLIDYIVKNKLTKYNHQPIFTPQIGRPNVKKILVVDQSFGDMSIIKGRSNEQTFINMLQSAIDENPDADIIVKTHPDIMTGNRGGYYSHLKAYDNVYLQTDPINPISLIEYADKVYVVSTQFGFEALMCGKEVHVFGMPFYAGWGLTNDRQNNIRRNNLRSLEELFYISYVLYTHWVNPETRKRCEIEEAMDYLLKLRAEYFEKFNVRRDK